MPVRIYDIARKLGVPNKQVIARAKALGIANAKVPSSSLDKITAEYLVEQMAGDAEPPKVTLTKEEPKPIVVVTEKEVEPKDLQPPSPEPSPKEADAGDVIEVPETATTEPASAAREEAASTEPPVREKEPPGEAQPKVEKTAGTEESSAPPEKSDAIVEGQKEIAGAVEPETIPPAETPAEEPAPTKPGLGEKIGFIKLPARKPVQRQRENQETQRKVPAKRETRHPAEGSKPGPAFSPTRPAKPIQPPEEPRPAEVKFVEPSGGQIITIKPPIIVRDLAQKIHRKPFQVIADLMELNVFATVNQAIDEIIAKKVCAKNGFRFEIEKREKGGGVTRRKEKVKLDSEDTESDLEIRAPVVTIVGHVDHGKTTLLDAIRKSNVVAGEAGGITQHIGAYTISFPHPERQNELQQITFLDTPGHAAFSAMRARGTNVTDIVVLVVAADDGIMPQTIEALNHAKAAAVPIIVAVNKMDHPGANPLKVRQQLQDQGFVCEEWGGETIFVNISALKHQGVDTLLEMILLQAEIMELKANPNRRAVGNVIESGMQQGGPTATVLVRKGTLRLGDTVICGPFWGRVKALINEERHRLKQAGPSVAVRILGLNGVPEAGLEFNVVSSEKQARKLGEERQEQQRAKTAEKRNAVTLENLFDTLSAEAAKALKLVVKADTQGSCEAIVGALERIESRKVSIDIIHSGVGTISESDVMLASASHAIIIGFHTRLDAGVGDAAKRESVQIKLYSVIYELIDDIRDAMTGLLEPVLKRTVTGAAEIRKRFEMSKGGKVAGCLVTEGRITKGKARVLRNQELIFEGVIHSLRHFQDEVNEVRSGMECGIRFEGFGGFEEGDLIESFTLEKIAQEL